MKRVVFLLIPMFLFSSVPTSFSSTQSQEARLLIVDFEKIPVLLETDAGRTESDMKGQVVIRRSFDRQEQVILEVQSFNLMIGSVRSERGATGPISFGLTKPYKTTAQSSRGTDMFDLALSFTTHYPLITRVRGYMRADEKQEDDYPAYTEDFFSSLRGQLVPPKDDNEPGAGSLAIEGDIVLAQRFVLGSVRRVILDFRVRITDILARFCPDGSLASLRTLCVRPVYVRSGPTDSTTVQETYFNDELNTANMVWGRCCVRFDMGTVTYVNREDLQVITTNDGFTSTEESDLLDEVNDSDCVEVFIIEANIPVDAHGGGATWGGGTADTKIISTANNPPINQRHLAHELGHAMGLCHPGTGCTAPRADGTVGSLMEPSGFYADNPDVLRQAECTNISNPILQTTGSLCCRRPDE